MLQNNSARRGKRENPVYRKETNRYIVIKFIVDKIEAGELTMDLWDGYEYDDLYALYRGYKLKEQYKRWEKEFLGDSYLGWMEKKLKKLKVKLEP